MNQRADFAKKGCFVMTVFLQIALISERFELRIPDWSQMKDILM